MSTILVLRDTKGKVLSRCNEKCYDALTIGCDCVCKGRNHGVGEKKAIANLSDFVTGFQVAYLMANDERQTILSRGRLYPEQKQLTLF